jgi:hypothetical protein
MSSKQTLYLIINSKYRAVLRNLYANWFTYGLLCIIFLAIYKKHESRVLSLRQIFPPINTYNQPPLTQAMGLLDLSDATAHSQAQMVQQFIQRFEATARQEEEKFGIPAGVILATAIVQSQCGTNQMAKVQRNYFGLLCQGRKQEQCTETFSTPWESFRAFSVRLTAVTGKKRPKTKDAWIQKIVGAQIFAEGAYEQNVKLIMQQYNL